MDNKIQITQKGLEALEEQLRVLIEEKRPSMVERLSNARAAGDLSENSDYQNAREELEFIDGKISELQEVIKNAQVVKIEGNGGSVDFGSHVVVKIDGTKTQYHVVGEWEADPSQQKISYTSPLGQALVGKRKGDKVNVEAPAGKISYEILGVK